MNENPKPFFSERVINCIMAHKLQDKFVEDYCQCELLKIRNLGKKGIEHIFETIEKLK